MNKKIIFPALASLAIALGACHKESRLTVSFPERFEGKTVEMISYLDSTLVSSAVVKDGTAEFITEETDDMKLPVFMQLSVDGRICAYYIAEKGHATVSDSTNLATGTPMNDRFAAIMEKMDSIENLDDMSLYLDFAEDQYNKNRDNAMGGYFGIEWMKYAEPRKVDSLVNVADRKFKRSRRVAYYLNQAHLRSVTSPGNMYVDFKGETVDGKPQSLSSLIRKGRYTLIDFWASWCPYCIKELPDLKKLQAEMSDRLDIIGVAVRDVPSDTKATVDKHEIPWKILYNTQRVPYDIYGFTGIPHHILLDPYGLIMSRGENVEQIRKRLTETETELP